MFTRLKTPRYGLLVNPIEMLFGSFGHLTHASRLSSDWESARLKIESSPVQIGEAALLQRSSSVRLDGYSSKHVCGHGGCPLNSSENETTSRSLGLLRL